jgi:hypothetical protein
MGKCILKVESFEKTLNLTKNKLLNVLELFVYFGVIYGTRFFLRFIFSHFVTKKCRLSL